MGFTWFPQVFCGFFGFLCDLGHKMGDFTGDYWWFGVCGGSGLGKTNLAKTPFFKHVGFSSLECPVPDAPLLQLLRRESYID